jgi:hypothetical protein
MNFVRIALSMGISVWLGIAAGIPASASPDVTAAKDTTSGGMEISSSRDLSPPPRDEWRKHMPPGYVHSELANHIFRVAYLIPNDRTIQPLGVEKLQYFVPLYQAFYKDWMERYGFGAKTFQYETETDGVTPKINVIYGSHDAAYYRVDPWSRVGTDCQNKGLPIWTSGQQWLITYEAQTMNSDGTLVGGFNGGSSWGNGSDAGVGMSVAGTVATLDSWDILDDRKYNGLIFPQWGPYPFVQYTTRSWSDGQSISELSSVDHGIFMHECGHGFYLWHDWRNDTNFRGNLEYNGFRGTRGWIHPEYYPTNNTILSYAGALALNINRYFNYNQTFTDSTKPTVAFGAITSPVIPVNGQLEFPFTATDDSGLALALLRRDGTTIGEMILSGTSVTTAFRTPYYPKGSAITWGITIFDAQGNIQNTESVFTSASGYNAAPVPYVYALPSCAYTGDTITVSAIGSNDPEGESPLTIEWDLNNDGVFDTAPSTNLILQLVYDTPQVRAVRARLTDARGYQSLSTVIGLRIKQKPPTVAGHNWPLYE